MQTMMVDGHGCLTSRKEAIVGYVDQHLANSPVFGVVIEELDAS